MSSDCFNPYELKYLELFHTVRVDGRRSTSVQKHFHSKPQIYPCHPHHLACTMTSHDETSLARRLRRTKRRLLLEFANAPILVGGPVVGAGSAQHQQQLQTASPGLRSGSSASIDSHDNVSEERKLQRVKRQILLDQGGQKSSQTHFVEELWMDPMVPMGSPVPPDMPKSELETTFAIKEVLPLLDNRGMAALPSTNIRGAKMA
jgi:hypothetical protein